MKISIGVLVMVATMTCGSESEPLLSGNKTLLSRTRSDDFIAQSVSLSLVVNDAVQPDSDNDRPIHTIGSVILHNGERELVCARCISLNSKPLKILGLIPNVSQKKKK